MAETEIIDINTLIDGQKVRRSTVVILVVITLALVTDGFDIAAMGFVGPELAKAWHLAPGSLVPVYTAGIFGLLVGAPVLGFVGDRYGRKTAAVLGLTIAGLLTLATALATSIEQMMVLRFLAGIGLGGMGPNMIAMTAELAPKRLRGRFLVFTQFGVPTGIALPGFAAAALVPSYGWPVLFVLGGILPLLMIPLLVLFLPESLKFLTQHGGRDEAARVVARRMRPDLVIGPTTRFIAPGTPKEGASLSPARLFGGGRGLATPMLWISLAANQMTNFFTITWLPTLLQQAGSTTAQAGVNAALFSVGGLAGGFTLNFLVDRLGALPMVFLFCAGVPLIASIGTSGIAPEWAWLIIAAAGFCVTGNNFGMNATMGVIYPTPMRSIGAGWAQALGRVGAMTAPLVGGMLLHSNLSMSELLFVPAMVLAAGAVAWTMFTFACYRRFNGFRLGEFQTAVADPVRAVAPAPAE